MKNDLDKKLWEEIETCSPNEDNIKYLVAKGANINSINDIDDNILIRVIDRIEKESDLGIIKTIIELGININYKVYGFNCLFHANLTNRSDLVELLLKNGADPQCLSAESFATLLDWIESNRWFHVEVEKDVDIDWINNADKIIELLKTYGAKTIFDHANKIEDYLIVTGHIESGLYTKYGYINIEDIPNISIKAKNDFKEWLNNISEIATDIGNGIFENEKLLKKNNDEGTSIAKELRDIISDDTITIIYHSLEINRCDIKEIIMERKL
jgi:ankyrin repeat protein